MSAEQQCSDLQLSHDVVQEDSIQQVREVQMLAPIIRHERLHLHRKVHRWGWHSFILSRQTPAALTHVTSGLSMNWSRQFRNTPLSILSVQQEPRPPQEERSPQTPSGAQQSDATLSNVHPRRVPQQLTRILCAPLLQPHQLSTPDLPLLLLWLLPLLLVTEATRANSFFFFF